MFNADLIIRGMMASFGRASTLAPILKTAVARPMANRFRTGMTVAMFGLVVLTVVITSATTYAISQGLNDIDTFGGGFELRAAVLPGSAASDLGSRISEADTSGSGAVERIAGQSVLALEARQLGTEQHREAFPAFGFDDTFFAEAPYALATRASGYDTDEAVWAALEANPRYAVITHLAVPTREALISLGAGLPDFQLEGFYLEDQGFDPVDVELRDPQTGASTTVTVLGVLGYISPDQFLSGIITSQERMLEAFGDQAHPTAYWIDLADGNDASTVAADLEDAFFAEGMQVEVLRELLDEIDAGNRALTYLVQGSWDWGSSSAWLRSR